MHASSSGPWMIVSADNACVAGDFEASPDAAASPLPAEPDPGDTVRLPALEGAMGRRSRAS
ncbi:MAG: hypothetical protein KDK70_37445 [Myxococcales bacterium]|nr:hypothetical protein [Myxococcales bacterium]